MPIDQPVFQLVRRSAPAPAAGRPTASQRQVIDFDGARLLVLGGPGAGKTTVLAATAAAQLAVQPDWRALLISPDRAAAEALRIELAQRSPEVWDRVRVMTWYGLAFSLLPATGPGGAARWLSASRADQRWRDLIDQTGPAGWPAELAQACRTGRFARQTRQAMERLRRQGWSPESLESRGRAAGRADWRALAGLWSDYADIKAWHGDFDSGDLMAQALAAVERPDWRTGSGLGKDLVLIDQYEEIEPDQLRLLEALARSVSRLIVFADPCQTVAGFRGARPASAFDFARSPVAGATSAVVELWERRRWGTALDPVERRLRAGLALPRRWPQPSSELDQTQTDEPTGDRVTGQGVAAVVYPSPRAEAESIARRLSQWRAEEGWDWTEMAVVVRSGGPIPGLVSALTAAGVPVSLAWSEIPLAGEPAAVTLLTALQLCVQVDPAQDPRWPRLVASPWAGLDPADQAAWAAGPATAAGAETAPSLSRSGDRRLAELRHRLERARQCLEAGSGPVEPLWELWRGSPWASALRAELVRGPAAEQAADRQLDVVCALFELAHELGDVAGPAGVTALVERVTEQEIPGRGGRRLRPGRPGVSILTAHRAKGRQWSAVVVASVCEGIWPVVDSAAELIDLTELSPDGQCAPPGPSEQMASERRLFYVACTRARHRLLVTTVDQNRAVGLRPSRLIDRLGCPIEPEDRTEPSWLGLNQLVGGLRRVTTDPVAHPSLRQAAAARLADLASRPDPVSGRRLVRQADPERWWPVGGDGGGDLESTWRLGPGQAGAADAGAGPEPIDGPWRLTGSHLRSLLSCPRQWFLARRAKAEGPPGPAAAVGALVHRLVQDLGSGSIDRSQADRRLDREWPEILFPAQWQAAAERRAAGETLDRFERWLSQRTGWRLLGVEVPFELSLTIGQGRFQLVGRIDRIDQDASGRIRLTDFKTARRPLSAAQAESDDQLGVYQLAVRSGGLADLTGTAPRLAAAELVYLRCPAGPQGAQPTLRRQPSLDLTPHLQRDPPSLGLTEAGLAQVGPAQVWPTWVHRRLALAGQMMTEGRFPALAQAGCAWCQFAASCPAGRPDQEDA